MRTMEGCGAETALTDSDKFEDVFRDLLPHARHVARRILGDTAAAEDAAAEAFARALASWKRVSRLPYRDAWILRVTANVAIDMARKSQRQQPAAVDPDRAVADSQDRVATRLALGAALAKLPRRQREVVVLRYLADLREPDVADYLGVSLGTVQQHAHRALTSLMPSRNLVPTRPAWSSRRVPVSASQRP